MVSGACPSDRLLTAKQACRFSSIAFFTKSKCLLAVVMLSGHAPPKRRIASFQGLIYPGVMVAFARTRYMVRVAMAVAVLFTWSLTACRLSPSGSVGDPSDNLVPDPERVPSHITRIAVWYPSTDDRDAAYGYMKLEQATFHLKKRRSGIRIVERRYLETVRDEQRLQVSGKVADDSAMHIGKWLGADSLVMFQIDQPRWQDRLSARYYERMAPVVVSIKILAVETGEVLYYDIVRIVPGFPAAKWERYGNDAELRSTVRASLDRAVSVAIAHLDHSFR